MKKFKIKDTRALYVKKVEKFIYCDFCELGGYTALIELEDENETQICLSCIKELYKVGMKLLNTQEPGTLPVAKKRSI